MLILKSIGGIFVKLWRWIKETAWVQPLLIVGAIFAIIFSIPYITDWAKSLNGESTNSFYNASKMTLEGENLPLSTEKSNADVFTERIDANRAAVASGATLDTTNGEKFFLIFANSAESASSGTETAFKYLSDRWNTGVFGIDDGNPTLTEFKYYVIFSDDTSSNDDDIEIKDHGTAFDRYLTRNLDVFQTSFDTLSLAPYIDNTHSSLDNYEKFCFATIDTTKSMSAQFVVPTVALVDFSKAAIEQHRYGISEAIFSVEGSTDSDKAKVLLDMWNHTGDDKQNKFSKAYQG
ncbi:MAG: hypothetical protein K5694_04815 [Bacilli bacterium]|nr:hypothetical protein [Bacilli bacterium]